MGASVSFQPDQASCPRHELLVVALSTALSHRLGNVHRARELAGLAADSRTLTPYPHRAACIEDGFSGPRRSALVSL